MTLPSARGVMKTALCWAITFRVVVIPYGLFGTTYQPIGPLKMRPIGCPETSVRNDHYSLRNSPEESSCHLLRGGSLKSQLERVPVKSAPGSPSFFFADHHFCMQRLFLCICAFHIHFEPLLYSVTLPINVQIMMLPMMLFFNQQISDNNYYNDNTYNKITCHCYALSWETVDWYGSIAEWL